MNGISFHDAVDMGLDKLTFDEAHDLIRALGRIHRIPLKQWTPEDLDDFVNDYPVETRDRLRQQAWDRLYDRGVLEDASDDDWFLIQDAVGRAAETLDIEEE